MQQKVPDTAIIVKPITATSVHASAGQDQILDKPLGSMRIPEIEPEIVCMNDKATAWSK